MKKTFYAACFIVVIFLTQSCEKHMDAVTKTVSIDTTLVSGQEYQLNLQQYGDADDVATIVTQAKNFSVSEVTNTAGTFAPVYHYSAFSKGTVTDQVVLAVSEGVKVGRGGRGDCTKRGDSTIITINFNVK